MNAIDIVDTEVRITQQASLISKGNPSGGELLSYFRDSDDKNRIAETG